MKQIISLIILLISIQVSAQSYTSYFTGDVNDIGTVPIGGTCMMGGAGEHDEAMKWFLERANGGDVLILRASGSDGYNDYMYTDLGVNINSVETIVFNNSNASNEIYVQNKIKNAEAIWFAGGDQWDYISYWRNTAIDSLINDGIQNRNIVIGGTSAGMAILGKYYFSAVNGTVTSATALSNPYNTNVTVDSSKFIQVDYLNNVITDSHYDDPDRKGRHIVFLARILTDYGVSAKGIACNEYTSVCVDENGLAKVFGDYPNYPETAYFLQTNCEIQNYNPENCSDSSPLDWNLDQTAIRVYKVNGTNSGSNTFDLSDWSTGNGGTWENWYVNNGTLYESAGTQIDCSTLSTEERIIWEPMIYPNPFDKKIVIQSQQEVIQYILTDINGKVVLSNNKLEKKLIFIDDISLNSGVYFLKVFTKSDVYYHKLIKE
jgi:cyanophycinase-like exopeptidase